MRLAIRLLIMSCVGFVCGPVEDPTHAAARRLHCEQRASELSSCVSAARERYESTSAGKLIGTAVFPASGVGRTTEMLVMPSSTMVSAQHEAPMSSMIAIQLGFLDRRNFSREGTARSSILYM